MRSWLGWIRAVGAPADRGDTAGHQRFGRADWLALLLLAAGILGFAHEYINPFRSGIPVGIDLGDDLAYLGILRSELLDSGRLLTWWSTAYDGIPLLGHPNTQFFYPPLILPSLAFGAATGARVAYVFSLLLAGGGMYFFARLLGPRPAIAAWAGLLYTMSGGFAARIHAGHLQKVLAMPFIPLVLACALLVGRAGSLRGVAFWALLAGLFHGFTFLAGESFLPVYLYFGVLLVMVFTARGDGAVKRHQRLLLGLAGWATGMAVATSGKLVAATAVMPETIRQVDPFVGGQNAHWAIVHLAFPFFSAVPGLQSFSYGPEQVTWTWGWWEYTQYISVVPVMLAMLAAVLILFRLGSWRSSGVFSVRRRDVAALAGLCILGALWQANGQWYSPVRWLYEVVTPLQNFRVPSRALMLAAPAALALAALGLEALLVSRASRTRVVILLLGAFSVGAVWWANASWLRPVQWACDATPGLRELPFPACAVTLVVLGVLVLSVVGLWFLRLEPERRQATYSLILSFIALIALADVYHATRAIPRVAEAPVIPSVRRVIAELQTRDSGPFLVSLGSGDKGFAGKPGMYINKSVRFEFADRGISVDEDVAPLVPEQQNQHRVIGIEHRMRYKVLPVSDATSLPKGWSRLFEDGEVAVLVNNQARGGAWLADQGEIEPLQVESWWPGRFLVRTSAPRGATVVVPANSFSGWRVSIDGGRSRPASDFDGFAAVETEPGEHTYELFYKAPLLPVILVLGALPWVLTAALAAWGISTTLRRRSAVTRPQS